MSFRCQNKQCNIVTDKTFNMPLTIIQKCYLQVYFIYVQLDHISLPDSVIFQTS